MLDTTRAVVFLAGICAVIFADSCSKPTSATCDKTILQCCDKNFRTTLNLQSECSGETAYDSPICFQQAIQKIYFGQGNPGVRSVCEAFNDFRNCLDISTRSCTTIPWYITTQAKEAYIAQYAQALYTQMQFQCGAGLDAFLNNEQCILKNFQAHASELDACAQQFGRNIFGKNVEQDACDYVEQLMGCYERVFLNNCNIEAAWWGCEVNRLTALTFFPQCGNTCSQKFDIPPRVG
jgi:hypothetical protein